MADTTDAPRLPVPYFHVRKVRFLFWSWSITDGQVGPALVGPRRALTGRAAYRRGTRALRVLETQDQS